MSRINFHFDDGKTLEVPGCERAYMSGIINELAFPCYGISENRTENDPLLNRMIGLRPPPAGRDMVGQAKMWVMSLCSDNLFDLPNAPNPWQTSLNTVMLIGQPMLRLMARLHGQCEIHCWAEHNTVNDFIEIREAILAGLQCGLYRKEMGWEALAERLGSRCPGAFVCSYSVCESFPNTNHLDTYQMSDADLDKWHDLPFAERWAPAFAALKKEHGGMLRIKSLKDPYWFGDGLTAFDVRRIANEQSSRTQNVDNTDRETGDDKH